MKHKKEAVTRDFWIPVVVLALDALLSNLQFLNSKRDYLHPKGNMGISMRFTKSAITLYLVLNTMMDGSHSDAGGLRAKAMYNHRPSFPSYIPAKATSPETSDRQQPNTTYPWSEQQQSCLELLASHQGVELSSIQNCQTSMKAPREVVECHTQLQGHLLATPALCIYMESFEFMIYF